MRVRGKLSKALAGVVCSAVLSGQVMGQRAKRPPAPRRHVLESVSTRAGILQLVRIEDDWIGETNWAVTLGRKTVYRTQDDVFGSVKFHTIFKASPPGELVLLREAFGTTPDCVQFRVLYLTSAATVSDRFGTCDAEPEVTLQADKLTLSFLPAAEAAARSERWLFRDGKLTRLTPE